MEYKGLNLWSEGTTSRMKICLRFFSLKSIKSFLRIKSFSCLLLIFTCSHPQQSVMTIEISGLNNALVHVRNLSHNNL